jgi:hypothetical protein
MNINTQKMKILPKNVVVMKEIMPRYIANIYIESRIRVY